MVWSSAPRYIASMMPKTILRISTCESGLCPCQRLWAAAVSAAVLAEGIACSSLRRAPLHRPAGGEIQERRERSWYERYNADRYTHMGDADIAEFAKPTDAMIDAAYEAVRFDKAWAINSRRDFVKAVKAMVRHTLGKQIRRQELDGFVEGLFGAEETMDLPERAHRSLGTLGGPSLAGEARIYWEPRMLKPL